MGWGSPATARDLGQKRRSAATSPNFGGCHAHPGSCTKRNGSCGQPFAARPAGPGWPQPLGRKCRCSHTPGPRADPLQQTHWSQGAQDGARGDWRWRVTRRQCAATILAGPLKSALQKVSVFKLFGPGPGGSGATGRPHGAILGPPGASRKPPGPTAKQTPKPMRQNESIKQSSSLTWTQEAEL